MEPLTLAILKTVATTLVKLYVTSLLGGSNALIYNEKELGYKVPRWYMNPGDPGEVFYAYGTSLQGSEFDSLEDAKQRAHEQMVNHIRLANQKVIADHVRFNKEDLKQKRLVEMFMRGDGLEDFIRLHAQTDKQQLVKVAKPAEDMRAFVRLALQAPDYFKYQEQWLGELKRKLMYAKTEDIMAEVDAEVKALEQGRGEGNPDEPAPTPKSQGSPITGADAAFNELEKVTSPPPAPAPVPAPAP